VPSDKDGVDIIPKKDDCNKLGIFSVSHEFGGDAGRVGEGLDETKGEEEERLYVCDHRWHLRCLEREEKNKGADKWDVTVNGRLRVNCGKCSKAGWVAIVGQGSQASKMEEGGSDELMDMDMDVGEVESEYEVEMVCGVRGNQD